MIDEKPVNRCRNCDELLEKFKTDDTLLNVVFSVTKREYIVVVMRFALHYSLEEVGKYFSVTRERIRDIEKKSLRKIRHRCSLNGLKITDDDLFNLLKENLYNLPGVTKRVNVEWSFGPSFELPDVQEMRKVLPQVARDSSIKDLDFSVRIEKCLLAVGIKTVGDLIVKSEDSLLQIKNLGHKSVNEIKSTLATLKDQ